MNTVKDLLELALEDGPAWSVLSIRLVTWPTVAACCGADGSPPGVVLQSPLPSARWSP